jgi:hypothetical protein
MSLALQNPMESDGKEVISHEQIPERHFSRGGSGGFG